MRSLDGASILVTGGGSGLGAAAAVWLAHHGARVTICGRRAEKLVAVAAAAGPGCRSVQADVTAASDRTRVLEAAVEHGGGLDGLVHAAGNIVRGGIAEIREDDLKALFDGNVIAPMLLTGEALPHLVRSRGSVVFFGSVHTQRAFPGASAYAATKGALETITAVLAAELGGQGVRVNAIRPGGVFTELNQRAGWIDEETARARLDAMAPAHALGRLGTAEEIAEGVLYLLTAEWVTGIVLGVDGGLALGVTNA
jgi:NAD(P)-dependent dehydrogenase (short-subunit alcohol dehydrogenase family)